METRLCFQMLSPPVHSPTSGFYVLVFFNPLGSIFQCDLHVCVSAQYFSSSSYFLEILYYAKWKATPFPVMSFFLFQESRINCIRIARKGNSRWILLLPQTLWPWMNSPASFLSAWWCCLLSHCFWIRNEQRALNCIV